MRFLGRRDKKSKKVVLVISDLHLSAGAIIKGKRNPLEDFHADSELISFLDYFSTGEYLNKNVELVINGDFLDLLAVPFVRYFDDEFWSEKASLDKLELILNAHSEVFEALGRFASGKNKKIVYIIGNHDAEMIFDSLQERFRKIFSENDQKNVTISNDITLYNPVKGVYIQHGHEYEIPHHFSPENNIIQTQSGQKYFIPPVGSYYVTHVINKYKQERTHINGVRPIPNFIKHGLLFDTFFTLRFIIANIYYYFMVRFLYYYRLKLGWKRIIEDTLQEVAVFQDYETLTREFFVKHPDAKVLIVGHTHNPTIREYEDRTVFINTGTWTKVTNLDLSSVMSERALTFAFVQDFSSDDKTEVDVELCRWSPVPDLPYQEYN